MTNFERWKETLTPEKLVEMLRSDWDTANAEEFLAWANAPAEVRWNDGKAGDEAKETPKPRKADFATDVEYAVALIDYQLKEIARANAPA